MSHYSYGLSPKKLKIIGDVLAEKAISLVNGNPFVLAYTGFSGIATATAVGLALQEKESPNYGMVYVRKNGEKSHSGERIEIMDVTNKMMLYGELPFIILFVDDFVATGQTLKNVLWALCENFNIFREQSMLVGQLCTGGHCEMFEESAYCDEAYIENRCHNNSSDHLVTVNSDEINELTANDLLNII